MVCFWVYKRVKEFEAGRAEGAENPKHQPPHVLLFLSGSISQWSVGREGAGHVSDG